MRTTLSADYSFLDQNRADFIRDFTARIAASLNALTGQVGACHRALHMTLVLYKHRTRAGYCTV